MGKRVVIVDDTVFMRMSLKNILESFDYEVVGEGSDGFEAVALYKRLKPDMITMDITMPKKDGVAAVEEIIAFDPEAIIVMVSAMGQKTKVVEAVTAGAKDFVVKPFKPDRIIQALARLDGSETEAEQEIEPEEEAKTEAKSEAEQPPETTS
jgi:two-component system, chemotaxis family, chemotaxis protein CheY